MTDDGWYYLHENGDLIWKRFKPEDDSPFVKAFWEVNIKDRGCAWRVVLEALAKGAKIGRIRELAEKWGLTLEDSVKLLKRTPSEGVTHDMMTGLSIFVDEILGMGSSDYWGKVKEAWDK